MADGRERAGKFIAPAEFDIILSQLARDPKTKKITEKIEIYTHSRGAAFGAGYTEELLKLIDEHRDQFKDPDHEIDLVLNLAPHQSGDIIAPKGVDEYSIHHKGDILSGNKMGNNTAFETNTAAGNRSLAHQNKSFNREVKAFLNSWKKDKENKEKLINDFVSSLQNMGITVTVNGK